MVQAGSNDEKNWPSKISLDCPFKDKKQCSKITHNTQLSIDYIVFMNGYTVYCVSILSWWFMADYTVHISILLWRFMDGYTV